ncbi:MAG: hypothetical protein ABI851_15710 [Saprospiraceae bacterium]
MNRSKILYLLLIISLLTNCHQRDTNSLSSSYISFKVDSIKIYNAKDIPKFTFIFSPLQHKDKIWTINTNNAQELDLKTGVWSPLSLKFGNQLNYQLNEDMIWYDKYTSETYISCFHAGLIRYYPEKDTFDLLKIHSVSAFCSSKENIALGTVNGLYFLNRKNNKINIAENFPLDIWVNSIQELSNDTLFINYKYYYHTTSNSFGEIIICNPKKEIKSNYKQVSIETRNKLPNSGRSFYEYKYEKITWYYREGELFYSKEKDIFYKFILFPNEYVRHIIEDKDNLYILFNDQFVIYNKEYIFRNSIVYNVLDYQELEKELLHKKNDLNDNKNSFDNYLKYSILLYTDKKYSSYRDLQNDLQYIPKNFEYYDYKEGLPNLSTILKNDTIPKEFKYNILKGLCRKYTISAKLDSALIYFNLIKELYPSDKDYCIDDSYPCVRVACKYLDSIRNENISVDGLLFLEAKELEKMISCSCWFGESYSNLSLVEKKYKEILTKHPKSEYVNDAEFWLLDYEFSDSENGSYSLDAIPKIRNFVNKYPNSKHIPELLMNIAYIYLDEFSENIDDKINSINKGIEELIKIKNNYHLDSLEFARLEQDLNQSEYHKNELIYGLAIVPSKEVYKLNEDIELEVIISNNSSTPKTLELFKNESYVSFGIYPGDKVKFVTIDATDTSKMEFEIIKGKPLKQNVKLNSLVRHWDGGKLGRFDFKEEGLYYLTCYSRENKLNSKQVKIYVQK